MMAEITPLAAFIASPFRRRWPYAIFFAADFLRRLRRA
jgi:hypothetical protein